jgi:Mg2+ and Co2+ transporter CorA
VTQQDAATSTTIAREAKADGTSMKVIAALTMVFLPGTCLSSIFGMAALEHAKWWLYVALTLPLTILVVVVWWLWVSYPSNFFGRKRRRAIIVRNKGSV